MPLPGLKITEKDTRMSLAHRFCIAFPSLFCGLVLAQTTQPTSTTMTAVPRLVRINSSFRPANGSPLGPIETATLAIYAAEVGGSPLWQETQTVSIDTDGHYSLL